jgi:hypothetical protein
MAWAGAALYPRRRMDVAGEPLLGLAELEGALASFDPAVRAAALERAAPGPGVEPLVVRALLDVSPRVRVAAVDAVARILASRLGDSGA